MATQVEEHTTSTLNPQNKIRKRAPKACLACRSRKVRCDVSQRSRPCTNCLLDEEPCVVTGRASRLRRRENGVKVQVSHPPYRVENGVQGLRMDESARVGQTRVSADAGPTETAGNDPLPDQHPSADVNINSNPNDVETRQTDTNMTEVAVSPQIDNGASDPTPAERSSLLDPQTLDRIPTISGNWTGEVSSTDLAFDIVYSYYPFLSMSNIQNIPPQDVNFLELQGCLRVPTRHLLDEFLQQYFLHVHPLLPLTNEGDFWETYCPSSTGGSSGDRVSLLLFQAILFASCNFVSKTTIKALGFPSIRTARAAYYRRAKLLYDLETETSPMAISQAALLLSLWSPRTTRKPNTTWLSIAVQNAMSVEAHHYAAMPEFSSITQPLQHKKQNVLKRIWWCCIIRDRTLGLLMRRPIQITRAHFDFDANPMLGSSDLADEFERSRVYNRTTKRCLAEILVQVIELYVALTDILMLVFPLDDAPGWGRETSPGDSGRVKECKLALRRWYKSATLRFPQFGGRPAPRLARQHDSVILYTNLMYMYYHSTRVVLCHHEVLHLAIVQAAPGSIGNATRDLSTIYESRHELQDAASGVTECLKELVHLRLARWLPISAVACTALPLVLNILDVKLSASESHSSFDTDASIAMKQHRLNILIEAMKTYQPQYDGVDWVSEIVRHIVNLAQLDSNNGQGSSPKSGITEWTDILASQPSSYLRLALALDLSLSKGRLPEDGDFPVHLRGLLPLKALIEQGRSGNAGGNVSTVAYGGGGIAERLTPESHTHSSPRSRAYSNMQTASQPSSPEEVANEALRDQIRTQIEQVRRQPSGQNMAPPSEGLKGLIGAENEVLSAGMRDSTATPSATTSEFEGMYIDGPMPDISAEWIENIWGEVGEMEDKTDRDTARVLLEALRDGDLGEMIV